MLNAYQKESEKTEPIEPRVCLAEVDRLVRSPSLSGSEALCKLLQFLANHTLNFPDDHLKEYEIATQVFGRPADFDPQADSGVRVQMGRLRTKLAEHYQTVGSDDPILVEVPKGGYSLTFRQRVISAITDPPQLIPLTPTVNPVRKGMRPSLLVGATALISIVVTTGVLLTSTHRSLGSSDHRSLGSSDTPSIQAAQATPTSLQTFWGPFSQSSQAPFVVFSNALFVGNPITGMRYYDPSKDSRDQISQHYTGIGEVMGVEELEGLFLRLGRQFQIKRGGLFTVDDARKNNLIFVGSPTENLTLDQIPQNSGFAFKRLQMGQNDWAQAVIDLRPGPGEASTYLPTSETQPLQVDYAVITLTQGLDRSRWTLMLAGASTVGTQAAVDFACDPDSVKDLLHRLDISPGAGMKPFEALLRVKVANDVPLTSELVKVRQTE